MGFSNCRVKELPSGVGPEGRVIGERRARGRGERGGGGFAGLLLLEEAEELAEPEDEGGGGDDYEPVGELEGDYAEEFAAYRYYHYLTQEDEEGDEAEAAASLEVEG